MAELFANNAASTIASTVLAGDTVINVTSGASFPSPTGGDFFRMTIATAGTEAVREIVYCTSRSGNALTVTRAQEGTSAAGWAAGDKAELRWTAGNGANLTKASGYDISGACYGRPAASQVMLRFIALRPFRIPAGATNSAAKSIAAATATATCTLLKNGSSFGTFSFAAAATTATWSVASNTDFAIGDIFSVTGPSSVDATLANLFFGFAGQLL